MKCENAEHLLGLYVEGDLLPSQRLQVESHIRSCAVCGKLAEELRESQLLLKLLRQDAAPSTSLAGVRRRVLEEVSVLDASPGLALKIERALFVGFRRKYAFAGLAVAGIVSALAFGIAWQRERVLPPGVDPVQVASVLEVGQPNPISTLSPQPERSEPQPKPARRPRRERPVSVESEKEPQPLLVKLFTDDPNVVIYWFVDKKGVTE